MLVDPARTCVGGMLAAAAELSIAIVPTYHAGASPGGTISEAAFAELKAQLMESLEGALRASDGDVSAVCLDLHGAGVYSEEHHHDLEAEVGRSVRALIGDDIPLVSTAACKRRFSRCAALHPAPPRASSRRAPPRRAAHPSPPPLGCVAAAVNVTKN